MKIYFPSFSVGFNGHLDMKVCPSLTLIVLSKKDWRRHKGLGELWVGKAQEQKPTNQHLLNGMDDSVEDNLVFSVSVTLGWLRICKYFRESHKEQQQKEHPTN